MRLVNDRPYAIREKPSLSLSLRRFRARVSAITVSITVGFNGISKASDLNHETTPTCRLSNGEIDLLQYSTQGLVTIGVKGNAQGAPT